jgi:ABC-2 type transport system permease protein
VIGSLRRGFSIYGAVAATAAKARLAYNMGLGRLLRHLRSMFIFVYFWRAVYAGSSTLGGMTLPQTINYILLARLLAPLVETRTIFFFGFMIRQGQIAVEMTRPLDMQLRIFVESLAELATFLVQRLPLFVIAWLLFGLRTESPALARRVRRLAHPGGPCFIFDWMFACTAFYVTETGAWAWCVSRWVITQRRPRHSGDDARGCRT